MKIYRGIIPILLCLSLVGCEGILGPKGPPHDPLLVVHKPLDGKAVSGPPTVIAFSEPDLPRHFDELEKQPSFAGSTQRPIPGVLTNRVRDPRLREGPKEP